MKQFLSQLDHDRIIAAIGESEKATSGQIRVHVTRRRPTDLEARARRRFEKLGMTQTRHRNGVLIYIAPNLGSLNAHTFGTDEDAYIVLNGVLVDHLTELELLGVIGHECGHIQNNHVVFSTALYYLNVAASFYVDRVEAALPNGLQAIGETLREQLDSASN